jgi:hypothetical protein
VRRVSKRQNTDIGGAKEEGPGTASLRGPGR